MMTYKEFESFLRNRPVPDTPSFYKLTIYKWHKPWEGELHGRYEAAPLTVTDEGKEVSGFRWRFPFTEGYKEPDYEYHPTFEEAHTAMMGYVAAKDKDTYGFCIDRLGYGPQGNHDWYISYRQYDAEGREVGRSCCSSYHYRLPGIHGNFLGRLPEEITFKEGDIVQVVISLFEDKRDYATLCVVIGTPRTVKEYYELYREHIEQGGFEYNFFYAPDTLGADADEYFVLFGPYSKDLRFTTFPMAVNVRPPGFPVPDDVRETLMKYYHDYMEGCKNED